LAIGLLLIASVPAAWTAPAGAKLAPAGHATAAPVEIIASTPAAETLLPKTTKGFLSVTNVTELDGRWNQTQLGHLMSDPAMGPFVKDLRHQFEDRLSDLRDRLGLTFEDLRGVPSGALTLALIEPEANQASMALLIDVSGRLDKAKVMLKTAATNLVGKGAQESHQETSSYSAWVYVTEPAPGAVTPARVTIYFLAGNLLGATDNRQVGEFILSQLSGKPGESLAQQSAFKEVMARCQKDLNQKDPGERDRDPEREAAGQKASGAKTPALKALGQKVQKALRKRKGIDRKALARTAPDIRWYIQPLGYVEAVRAATPEQDRRKGKTLIQVMRNQGFDAIQGMGGYISVNLETYEILHRTTIYAPPPWKKSMKMLVLPNAKDFAPQPWIPRDVATYTTLSIDILNAFDNFGTMFDELFGENGETGLWADVLQSLKDDPSGPQIDLRREMIQHLGHRVTVVSDYELPITTNSERLLYAIETNNEKAVAVALDKWMKGDKTAKKRDWNGQVIWEMVEPEEQEVPTISLEAVPSVNPAEPPAPKRVLGKRNTGDEEEVRLLPHAAVTAAHGHLLIASHLDFLKKILPQLALREQLARDVDYRLVNGTLGQFAPPERCLESFSRTDEEYRPTYELIKLGKMPESETMLARILNAMAGPTKKGVVRKQRINGSQMPDFQIVRRYLGPAGMEMSSEANGWFVKGFMLPKQSQ
jgi:hypothetical protein